MVKKVIILFWNVKCCFCVFGSLYSRGPRLPHSCDTGNAQVHFPGSSGPYHLPHRSGGEQCWGPRNRRSDAVDCYPDHIRSWKECEGLFYFIILSPVRWVNYGMIVVCLSFTSIHLIFLQEFLVALRLHGATLRHHMASTNHSWHEQVPIGN